MKSWAEMDAAARGGAVAVVGAVVALLFYGAWSVSRPPPVDEAEVTASGSQPEAATAPVASAPETTAPATAAPESEAAATAEPVPQPEAETPEEAEAETAVAEATVEEVTEPAAESAVSDAGASPAEPAPEAAEAAPVEETAAAAAPVAQAEEGAAVEEPAPTPPSFDLVRVEKDGSALVAGSAAPGATVSLRVVGSELAAVPTDAQGKFVAMFNLAPSAAPRVLSMNMVLADGTVVPADATVVIGPTIAPALVAEANVAEATGETAEPADTSAAAVVAEAAPEPVTEAPAALLVTDEGAKVLQSTAEVAPELVANVTIDTITYAASGAVQLAGRGTAERTVRLYLDNAQVAEAPIAAAGDWAVTLPEVAPGVYLLRADQLDADGKVTSRFETPFKRETVEALAAAADAVAPAPAADAETTEATTTADAADTDAAEAAPATTVTVQPGFTLWRIATENLGEGIRYVQVFEANKDQIRDPDLIYPGQVFTIPAAE